MGRVLRHAPQRRAGAGRGNKQQQHGQQGEPESRCALADGGADVGLVEHGQRHGNQHQTGEHPQPDRQALVEQHRACEQKYLHQCGHLPVSPRAAFKSFERAEQQQKRHAALQAEQRTGLQQHQRDDDAQHQHKLPERQFEPACEHEPHAQGEQPGKRGGHAQGQFGQHGQRYGKQCQLAGEDGF